MTKQEFDLELQKLKGSGRALSSKEDAERDPRDGKRRP